MPAKRLIAYADIANVMELADALAAPLEAKQITKRQWLALHATLARQLPASFVLEQRTPKGAVYLVTRQGETVVTCRAHVNHAGGER